MSGAVYRPCLFCNKRGKSPEHLFGDWMKRAIPRKQNEKHYTYKETARGIARGIGNGRAVAKRVKAPCTICNNEWMGRIEDAARIAITPLMHGSSTCVDEAQQAAIATWTCIKAMVWDYSQTLRAIPQSDRDYVLENRKPPPDWRVWLTATNAPFGHCEAYSAVRLFTRDNPDGSVWPEITKDPMANSQSFLISSGPFATITLRSPFLTQGALFDPGETFRPIWPLTGKADWPPKIVVPIDEAYGVPDTFLDALARGLGIPVRRRG